MLEQAFKRVISLGLGSLVLRPVSLVVGSLFLLLGVACKTGDATPEAKLLWSIDLSQNVSFRDRIANSSTLLRPPTIDFLDAKHIIVAFDDGLPSYPSEPHKKTFAFHVVGVDTRSGSLGASLSFPVNVDLSQARAVANGEFLVLTGEQLSKYPVTFKSSPRCQRRCFVMASRLSNYLAI